MIGWAAAGIALALTGAYLLFPERLLDATLKAQRRAAGLATREIDVDGHRVAYLDGGRGEPLVLLHGFGANKDHWPRAARWLTPHFRVIAPDLPGFGESSRRPEASYTLDEQLRRLHEFVDRLDLARFALGGNSMGGYLAAHYAARHPERVTKLWLLAPGGVLTAMESELQRVITNGENPLIVNTAADFERLARMCFHKPPYVPRAFRRVLAARNVADARFNIKVFQELFGDPRRLEDAAASLTVPTLVVWGDDDRLLHCSGAEILGRLLPRATTVVMPDMGHCPMLERPRETALRFLQFART